VVRHCKAISVALWLQYLESSLISKYQIAFELQAQWVLPAMLLS